ncbi:unnamed protein product [Vitrella brassicaformis CCMP3155]|uniref:Uncharacterized protein n=1 Tax=Vitrella brassicaformis (strain CCMP3155) TaxID=1169540 RepID=A0A0G4F6L4_VITBC|nr:unnamed protein product [Vitrella brassicaformis CCMP3155]|eukprot:CEM08060.1 unnamed protein product [Vitrella brassicaformis CCMP3155]
MRHVCARALLVTALHVSCITAQVRVLSPKDLVEEIRATGVENGVIPGTTATFGAPFDGKVVLGQLLYSHSATSHCMPDYNLVAAEPWDMDGGPKLLRIVLVDRGECSFVTKVEVAEDKGADAVIVVDSKNSTLTREDIKHIIMADDSWGKHIKIPSILLTHADGQRLIDAVVRAEEAGGDKYDQAVFAELTWSILQKDVVAVDFWTDAANEQGTRFLADYSKDAETLKGHLRFSPHYHIFSRPIDFYDLCKDKETAKFCADDPDGPGDITGHDVVLEDLRQLCLFSVTAEENVDGIKDSRYSKAFWEYIDRFAKECPIVDKAAARPPKGVSPDEYRFGEKCSLRILRGLIPKKMHEFETCVDGPDGLKLLEEEKENMAWSVLAIRINGWRFSGMLERNLVTKAVCSSFIEPPAPCKTLLKEMEGSLSKVTNNKGVGAGPVTLILLVTLVLLMLVVIVAIAVYFYQSYLRKSVRTALREEVMLEEQEKREQLQQAFAGETSV